jgi:organic hydroperoxide reductase OsmC/OhrA
MKLHDYQVSVTWVGNDGEGTRSYRSYRRDHEISGPGKAPIPGSSDPSFRGDPARYSPEELLVGSVSACHMLWYLHLCAVNGVTVLEYLDRATGEMAENADGSGQFVRIVLRPAIRLSAGGDKTRAHALHQEAHALCFIARSVNFPIEIEGAITVDKETPVL